MAVALINGRVMGDDGLRHGNAVVLESGRIGAVVPQADLPAAIPRRDLGGAMLLPGFIDTQVNGGGGVLFNDAPNVEGIAAIGRAHRAFGTTGFLPTLITDTAEATAADSAGPSAAAGGAACVCVTAGFTVPFALRWR